MSEATAADRDSSLRERLRSPGCVAFDADHSKTRRPLDRPCGPASQAGVIRSSFAQCAAAGAASGAGAMWASMNLMISPMEAISSSGCQSLWPSCR